MRVTRIPKESIPESTRAFHNNARTWCHQASAARLRTKKLWKGGKATIQPSRSSSPSPNPITGEGHKLLQSSTLVVEGAKVPLEPHCPNSSMQNHTQYSFIHPGAPRSVPDTPSCLGGGCRGSMNSYTQKESLPRLLGIGTMQINVQSTQHWPHTSSK